VSNVPHEFSTMARCQNFQFIFSFQSDRYSFISFGGGGNAKVIDMVTILYNGYQDRLSKQELLGCISQKHSQLWSQVLLICVVNHSWLRETHPRFHQLQKDRVIVSARSDLKTNLVDYAETRFHKMQHVPGSTSLLILEQHSNQPIRFEGQVFFMSSLGLQPGLGT